MKWFEYKKGSAYLSVLLVILVTSILGVGILTFTLANLKASTDAFGINNIFYKTEASISAVQVGIEQQVRLAQEKAKTDAELNRDSIMAIATIYNNETGVSTFDENVFKTEFEKYFCDSFNKYICADGLDNGKKVILALQNSIEGIKSISIPPYDANLIDNPKQDLFITVEAEKVDGSNKKTITASFKILREPSISLKKVVEKRRNPIWMRAITTEGDLIAVGGRVTINSSESTDPKLKKADAVYAWGTNNYRVDGTNSLGDKYGGIVAGVNQSIINGIGLSKFSLASQSGNIAILGETFTDSYIHTFGDNSSISIDVDNGQTDAVDTLGRDLTIPKVFAESIQTEEFSNYDNITISGDAMIKDDLEVNGSGGNINISGSFLGISSGPDSDFSTDKFANRSSSISYNDTLSTSTINIGKYIAISGVAYNSNVIYDVDPYKGTTYKTGESLAMGENHKIYRYFFNGEDINQSFDNGFKLNLDGKLYDYPVYSGKTGAPPNGVGTNRVNRFKDYLVKYYENSNNIDYEVKLGDNLINIGGVGKKIEGYSLGVLPANGKLYVPIPLTDADKASNACKSGLLKDFDYIYNSAVFNGLKDAWKTRYNNETWIANKKDARKNASEFPSLVDDTINFSMNSPIANDKLFLWAKEGDLEIDMSTISGRGGLIFATGNIVITGSGSGEFKGSIVAQGSIVFKGSGTKTITYSEANVLNAIKLNDNVRAYLSKGGLSEVDPDSVEIELKAQKNVLVVDYREV